MAVFQKTELYRHSWSPCRNSVIMLAQGEELEKNPSPPRSLPAVGLCFGMSCLLAVSIIKLLNPVLWIFRPGLISFSNKATWHFIVKFVVLSSYIQYFCYSNHWDCHLNSACPQMYNCIKLNPGALV